MSASQALHQPSDQPALRIREELLAILGSAAINQDSQLTRCHDLFARHSYKELFSYPSHARKKQFTDRIQALLAKVHQFIRRELAPILQAAKIDPERSLEKSFDLFNSLKMKELKKMADGPHAQGFMSSIMNLVDYLENDGYFKSTERQENGNGQNDEPVVVMLAIVGRKSQQKVTLYESMLAQKDSILNQTIRDMIKDGQAPYRVFLGGASIEIGDLQLQLGSQYNLKIYLPREYTINYRRINKTVLLIAELSLDYNKELIVQALVANKTLVLEGDEEPDPNSLNLAFKFVNEKKLYTFQSNETLINIEDESEIYKVFVEVLLSIKVFFDDIEHETKMSSSCTLKDLKDELTRNEHFSVPLESQILYFLDEENRNKLEDSQENSYINNLTSKFNIIFELENRESYEFYGFHDNVSLTFEMFSEFYVEDEEHTEKMITDCSFSSKNKEEQRKFIQNFFMCLSSAIKKRFPIQSTIDKFRILVSQSHECPIWKPLSESEFIKVNESFVFAYMLRNADSRLKIELMNLLRENMPIPLYLRQFDHIFKASDELVLNKELLWILKKGFTITSVGVHNPATADTQKGKSSFLNLIFPTHFEESQNKHAIVSKIPYISVRVFQNIYPVHVIDIPHDCPAHISREILRNSNLVMIHSWRSESETELVMSQAKNGYKIPVICLIRDCKRERNLSNLKRNIIEGKPQKIFNLSKKENCSEEISLIKEQTYSFIRENLKSQSQSNKLLGMYKSNEAYWDFSDLTSDIERRITDLTPIGNYLEKKKVEEKSADQQAKSRFQNEVAELHLSREIEQVLNFMMKVSVDEQMLLMNMLREKLKTYQNEINIKYLKIYEIRDEFQSIRQDSSNRRESIGQLNARIMELKHLQPEDIVGKDDRSISESISSMISLYENKVKPKIFSPELFWRELSYLVSLDQNVLLQHKLLLDVLIELKEVQIRHNLPFEIIDGDLLEMPKTLMRKLFGNKNDRAIVISILGPQSSGKSTLLNFLFGCDFATSEGRCTRGVYGTYFKFASRKGRFNNLINCEGIFVIDTEGLFAITNEKDKEDEERKDFDSKLVLFCLAVSDFVILNVRGNFDQNTEKIVKICHQRLESLNIEDEAKKPEIIVVLNQNATDKKEEMENQFKEIKKAINFNISKSLSLAYKIENYGNKQINLFSKNQILTKKYPLEAFAKETSYLMNQILKKIMKKNIVSKIPQIVEKFQRVWSMVVSFPNLYKAVTKEFYELEKKIKQWKLENEQQEKNEVFMLVQDYKNDKITEMKIMDEIDRRQKAFISHYEGEFSEKNSDENEIKILKRQEKDKINANTLLIKATTQNELEKIKLKRQINLSKVEGDISLREKAKQILNSQLETNKTMKQSELKKIFDMCFSDQLQKIEIATNLREETIKEYERIYDTYQLLIRNQTTNEIGLPRDIHQRDHILQSKDDIKSILQLVKEEVIEPRSTCYEDLMDHTNKIHTNIMKGGKKDATLKYFNMKEYFKEAKMTDYYAVNTRYMPSYLKKDLLREKYKIELERANQEVHIQADLRNIWDQINHSLRTIGLEFTNFQKFANHFNHQENITFLDLPSVSEGFEFKFTDRPASLYKQQRSRCQKASCLCQKSAQYLHSRQVVNHESHNFSIFLDQFAPSYFNKKDECLCEYSKSYPKHHLEVKFFKRINWAAIADAMTATDNYRRRQKLIDQRITSRLNQDLANCNLRIPEVISWVEFLKTNQSQRLRFSTITSELSVKAEDEIRASIQKCIYFSPRDIYSNLLKKDRKSEYHQDCLVLYAIENSKYEPVKKNSYFDSYLKQNTKLTINELRRPEFKKYIYHQLKENKKSFDLFFFNIFDIVEQVLKSWKMLEKKTYIEIINKVNQELSVFNDDLNQISCRLSVQYVGYINLAVVYMIWMLVIDDKVREKNQIYEAKKKDYEKEWSIFKARTSNDEEKKIETDLREFVQEFTDILKDMIRFQKDSNMQEEQRDFQLKNRRETVQDLIDMEVFSGNTSENRILQYLQNPYATVDRKYKELYDLSWKNVQLKLFSIKPGHDIVNQFYEMSQDIISLFQTVGINETKKMFSDIFQINNPSIMMSGSRVVNNDALKYEQQGKRIMFEYMIDLLLGENASRMRKCMNIEVVPQHKINLKSRPSSNLKNVLEKLKEKPHLEVTSFIKFLKALTNKEEVNYFYKTLDDMKEFTEKDNIAFYGMIKVVICDAKCPCCGRICGVENEHKFHQCLFGHQMRALNGTYLLRENGVKEASVVRCEVMAEPNIMDYNGKEYTWAEFKQYWKEKNFGGWLYDDANLLNNTNSLKFQQAWSIVGPIFCKKKGLKYVDSNEKELKKQLQQNEVQEKQSPVHYIFALDESGSMEGERWSNLKVSLTTTLNQIVQNDPDGICRVSILTFNKTAVVHQECVSAKDVSLNIVTRNGGTDFNAPFNQAASLARRHIQTYENVFIFMTDGQAGYPEDGVDHLRRLMNENPGKLHYAGIEFMSQAIVMKTIAKQLNGTSGAAYNPKELTQVFFEAIKEYIEFNE